MKRELTLAALALLVAVATVALVLLVPGALADRTDDVRSTQLDLRDPSVSVERVGGETADLSLDLRLAHRGGPAENVSVEVQAVDTETGLVTRTVRRDLGTIEGTSRSREVRTRVNVTVERDGGYRLVTRVYEDGSPTARRSVEVQGVGSLVPEYARTPVDFHRFEPGGADLPVISYSVRNVSADRAELDLSTYLTNRGEESAGGLDLTLIARQAESNVVADRTTVSVDGIEPGRTATPGATLTVPDSYNYHLDAILRRDGVIVSTASAPALLDPTRPVPENETREDVGFRAGDFERTDEPDDFGNTPVRTDAAEGPGFGVAAALAALAAAAIALRRKR